MLSAVRLLQALRLTTGIPSLVHHIICKRNKKQQTPSIPDDSKYKEMHDSVTIANAAHAPAAASAAVQAPPVTNLIGSGFVSGVGSGVNEEVNESK